MEIKVSPSGNNLVARIPQFCGRTFYHYGIGIAFRIRFLVWRLRSFWIGHTKLMKP